jgi:hypothetical protein
MHGVRTNTEPIFYRGPHGKESEEGKEDSESCQEGGKEDVKEEVVVSTTEMVRLRIKTGRKQISSKDLNGALHLFRYRREARQDRTFVQTAAAA